ncbi:GNAT family N-acetyltransferase [Ornithinibacillus halotolerans]|uniref:Acetyltransferase n=1 Tax=Ornithinibacillus halotolerans TaxID=1274357 RepID=A0A916S6P5_9BACI|nr:GNAT family N-acetyltransferase [Ornithinibacillus halotolerans]GGA86879.1 acetyltransferase [Ornithinibacillus halotolerans]
MIIELDKNEFYKCKHVINQDGQIEVKAVVEGINPGRVFVDNVLIPASGIVWLGNNDGFFFIGNEGNENFNNEISNFIDDFIMPEAKKVGLNWFEGMGNHSGWNSVLENVFKHRPFKTWNQKVYTLQMENYKAQSEPIIEPGFEVIKINQTLYNNKSISNINFLRNKISEFWSSPEQFFKEGIGFCIVHNNTIVSICFSGFVVDHVHCVDIETLENYQGKKQAQRIAHCFVKDCLENNRLPYWDCMESNKPSIAVAENIGFTNVFDYRGYYFPI